MIRRIFFILMWLLLWINIRAQENKDSAIMVEGNYITLSEIVVNNRLDVPFFIERVRSDTSFYKAFRNLRVVSYKSINDIRMLNKKGHIQASLRSKTWQQRHKGCRTMNILEETVTGDMYDQHRNFNYYTGQMYGGLFFTKGTVCGENNIVKGHEFSTKNLRGMEKHKEQLKMLFFNPGRKISGLPFISNKTELFDASMADKYDMHIDYRYYGKVPCYVFSVKVKPGKEHAVLINDMTTWFTDKDYEIVARNYALSYDAGVYDFEVEMQVEMTRIDNLLVPSLLKYHGNWKAIFKKRERGVFTATLFDFSKEN